MWVLFLTRDNVDIDSNDASNGQILLSFMRIMMMILKDFLCHQRFIQALSIKKKFIDYLSNVPKNNLRGQKVNLYFAICGEVGL